MPETIVNRGDGTHFKAMTDPVESQLPGGDCLLVTTRVETSGDRTSFTPLDDGPLDPRHSSAIESMVGESRIESISSGFTDIVS